MTRPPYSSLSEGTAVGLYGPDDQLGTLNLLTPERVSASAALIKTGNVFSLNAPLDYPDPHPGSLRRSPPTHVVIRRSLVHDDYLDGFFPQYSSQWDSFLHVRDPETGCFYNDNTNESIGIEVWANRGIAGRGVLLDLARWREAKGRALDWRARELVTVSELEQCAADQGVEIREGTVLILRFGWETGWLSTSWKERTRFVRSGFQSPGLEPSKAMAARLWDWGVAAIAADNLAVEAFPIKLEDNFLHVDLLARAGLPLGELWHLDELAAACAMQVRYEFFVTSAPLNLAGGRGSPANALAIL